MEGSQSPEQGTSSAPQAAYAMESILATLKPFAEYKERSYETSKNVHIPILQALTDPSKGPEVVFLGDGIFEDMITTGSCPNFPAPWPSSTLLSDAAIAHHTADDSYYHMHRAGRVLNAGVCGDRIQNLIYRLVGDEYEGGTLPGLLPQLARCGTVKHWVIHIGAHNVLPEERYGLPDKDLQALEQLVLALFKMDSTGGARVVLTYMFGERPGVCGGNEMIKYVRKKVYEIGCRNVSLLGGCQNVRLLKRPYGFSPDKHLIDDFHLTFEGYQLWAEHLWTLVPVAKVVHNEAFKDGFTPKLKTKGADE
jgi:platelet-activating factor acetylhydrolase IB subunit beta/gamma